jgi:hypothetical protein
MEMITKRAIQTNGKYYANVWFNRRRNCWNYEIVSMTTHDALVTKLDMNSKEECCRGIKECERDLNICVHQIADTTQVG